MNLYSDTAIEKKYMYRNDGARNKLSSYRKISLYRKAV